VSVTLAFVTLGCETIGELQYLVFVVPFKALALDVIPMWRVWVLDLLGWGDGKDLDIKAL